MTPSGHPAHPIPRWPAWAAGLITNASRDKDGYRALLLKDGARVQIRSRNEKDLTRMYPAVASAGVRLEAEQVVLDGEIMALDAGGRPSFQALQHRGTHPKHQVVFYAFDVLHLNGKDLTGEPLTRRRGLLPEILGQNATLRLSQELPGTAAAIVEAVRAAGLEGVFAKRKDSPYQPGERSSDWIKLKLERQQVRGTCDCSARILATGLKSFCRVRGRLHFG